MSDLDKTKHTSLLMREALAFLVLACISMVAVSLYSFHAEDPSLNQATTAPAQNMLGTVGAWISDMMYQLFGLASWLIVLLGIALMVRTVCAYRPYFAGWTSIFWLPCLMAISGLLHTHMSEQSMQMMPWGLLPAGAGGALGVLLVSALSESLYTLGSDLVLIALMLSSFVIASHISLLAVIERVALAVLWFLQHLPPFFSQAVEALQDQWHKAFAFLKARKSQAKPIQKKTIITKRSEKIDPEILQEPEEKPQTTNKESRDYSEPGINVPVAVKVLPIIPKELQHEQSTHTVTISGFVLPSVSLFTARGDTTRSYSAESLQLMSRMLEKKLLDYRVEGKIVAVQPGPVVVQFELEAAAGTKVSKVVSLQDDLARSMSAISVRVAGNIPGRNVIGIELPNESRQMVVLHDVLNSTAFSDKKKLLPLALGVDIAGKPVVVDLAKMPHLLVAGTTGSGKSVSVNTMICSMLLAHTPETLRLIMVDPKMLELSMYDDIPHLLVPVVTSPHKANKALAWAVFEMERRYKLMSEAKVRNLDGYNKQVSKQLEQGQAEVGVETLPLIVIIIDELADLMMVAGKEVEQSICRLAQKARAAGLHLILATQRPSVDVITGLIKANLPSRLAFKVSSKIDSRTILDQMGAEQLLGMGDSLLMSGSMDLHRVHGAFVDDDEVIALVEHLKTQDAPDYKDEVFSMSLDENENGMASGGSEEKDSKYDEAAALVIEKGKCSVSMVQRYLRIGYNRASRIVEQMENDGLVTPPGTAGNRKVLARSDGGVME